MDKDAPRAALSAGFTDLPVIVRIHPVGTASPAADLAVAAQSPFVAIMPPKTASLDNIIRVAAICPDVALIETAAGIAEARTIARYGHVARLVFGSVDFATDLGGNHVPEALAAARLGFGGKPAIHPHQIEPIKAALPPEPSEIEWARQVLDSGDGTVRIDRRAGAGSCTRRAGPCIPAIGDRNDAQCKSALTRCGLLA
ncbi:hypothetical protein F9288_11855 [Sphingomonas sp. CL5.1]|uniref:aldolase/citrate lyase family protein n=1 Tax=Sphingomonas sp. CL5.1 TaxID=2653203 RepID=UPI0015832B2A|nr:aldolase/citrate lyase family protein [Sphingomonas sp. CL5.1]QKS00237.1 hypothetical protein F9288_11855 [Sphingomonas sp. CL5.1]